MKSFDMPIIEIVDDLSIESVYAASGGIQGGGSGDGGWTICTEYCNHNSNSHSEVKVKCHNNGSGSGDNLSMSFGMKDNSGCTIDTITPGDGCLIVTNKSGCGFTLTRTNRHFNPGENIEFVMQVTFNRPDGSIGAIGTSGVYRDSDFVCTGYSVS